MLRAKGAYTSECMTGEIVGVPAVYTAQELAHVDVLLFTSANGVDYFMKMYLHRGWMHGHFPYQMCSDWTKDGRKTAGVWNLCRLYAGTFQQYESGTGIKGISGSGISRRSV